MVRIDHVLTAGDLTVTSILTHAGPGSDHRDLTATIAIGGDAKAGVRTQSTLPSPADQSP